ncbi:DUF4407 domain-containing protein [Flavihumibacter profundi]|uniref:DUF4407 domain-containing protein n=1 Tax=Flavihumibacter profundi TaxID=2716883 RepID=UPI001CC7F362|nr:DUF4407 domain-containing protein [Flavihumibacter profundi]MBZ5856252.1 DUF4407 domain-containing protein [Flavihumibacter profundi]
MPNSNQGQGNSIAGYDAFTGNGNKTGSFLWWCAAAHAPTLEEFPTEHPKYNTLGGVLLATFALAALSSGYAFYTIFGTVGWAMGFALLWGLIIFNFDRFMVATIRKYGISSSHQWRVAIPRILLAIMIGITIARPLELKLFEKEINLKVTANISNKIKNYNLQQDAIQQAITGPVLAERDQLLSRRKAMEDTLLKLQMSYVQEADGTGGSGKRGVESITILKQGAYQQTAGHFAQEFRQIDSGLLVKNKFLTEALVNLQKEKAVFAAAAINNIGFLERNKALHDLSGEEESVYTANLLISLLIILLEIAPVLAKLLLPVGPYDIALAKQELVPMTAIERALVSEQESARTGNLSAV